MRRFLKYRLLFLFAGMLLLAACQEQKPLDIYCIGDSTMANKKAEVYPETGWCQVVGDYFDESVTIHNHAVNGRSSKSFIDEGRWQVVLDSLNEGDVLFIQFGHNDEKDYDSTRYTTPWGTYSENLERFVTEARKKGAEPVLFTSIVRRKFGDDGMLTDTHGDYPPATRKVAEELKVPLIDLQKLTERWVTRMGDEPSKAMYLWTEPTERYPNGRQDDTHLQVEGAKNVARLAMEECRRQHLDFSDRIVLNN